MREKVEGHMEYVYIYLDVNNNGKGRDMPNYICKVAPIEEGTLGNSRLL